MIESVAAMHPDIASVVPLNKYLDPDGHFTSKIDGKVMRFADGVHTTEDAGTYLAPKILPQLPTMGGAGDRPEPGILQSGDGHRAGEAQDGTA